MKHNEGKIRHATARSLFAQSANNSQTIMFAHNLQRLFSVKCPSPYDEAIVNYKSIITSVLRTCFCAYFPPTLNLPNDSRSLALSPALQLSIYVNLLRTISRYACCCASVQNLKCVASMIY